MRYRRVSLVALVVGALASLPLIPAPGHAQTTVQPQSAGKPADPGAQGKAKGKKDKGAKLERFEAKVSGKWSIGVIPAGAPCAEIPLELGMDMEVRGVPPKLTGFAKRSLIEVTNGETLATVCWKDNQVAEVDAKFAYHLIEETAIEEDGEGDVLPGG